MLLQSKIVDITSAHSEQMDFDAKQFPLCLELLLVSTTKTKYFYHNGFRLVYKQIDNIFYNIVEKRHIIKSVY